MSLPTVHGHLYIHTDTASFRADWLSVNDVGRVTTWMNQRGWNAGVVPGSSKGIVPDWISRGATHGGMNTPGAGANIKFGRIYGSGRLDYTWFESDGRGKLAVNVWQNTGGGGTLLKGKELLPFVRDAKLTNL